MNDKELLEMFDITQDQAERWSDEAEKGDISAYKTDKIVRGRPKLFGEKMETITVRVPQSQANKIKDAASKSGMSKSEWCRRAMDNALKAS